MSHFYDMLVISQHKRSHPCHTRIRGNEQSIIKSMARRGTSGTVRRHLREQACERNERGKSLKNTKQACPAFFVASHTQQL